MSKSITEALQHNNFRKVDAPVLPSAPHRHQVEDDRSFELPTALYGATVGLYFAFLAIMFAGLSSPGLIIPMAIFAIFIAGMFGVPAVWTKLKSDNETAPMTLGKFEQKGIMTYTGRLSSRDASIQMLILPVLIVFWGIAVVTIAAITG